jgi:hypothetical protein
MEQTMKNKGGVPVTDCSQSGTPTTPILTSDVINLAGIQDGSQSDPPVQPSKVEQNADEIDFDALRLPPSGQIMVKRDLSIIPTRKPKKTEWFRVRSGAEWRIDLPLYVDDDGETFVVGPACLGFLHEQGLVKRARIYTILVYESGVLLLSPIGLPDEEGKINSYNRSREECYRKAETQWVRISANKDLGGYDCMTPEHVFPDPVWPAPPNTLKEALAIAFKSKYINELDHPIIKRLRGRL